ncbi:signal transduction histidine kinase [Marinobacter persicus]|uniref:histidine kinase n=2 Tax=Marinobacter persicus TaxID=930118 RepID=A0A2S6G4H6_9GAMM|nr:signal transduction histidine kinase [Marinobacter persicus]PPK54008.1 signal transduction histidine kinase [Marinobacter persicus]PPK57179.1 signal transduction histidine kinase [Marinobacter persicus]
MQAILPVQTRRPIKGWLLFFLVLFLPTHSTAADTKPRMLGPDIPYSVIKDTHSRLTVEQAAQALESTPATETTTLSQGYVPDTFWLKFELPPALFDGQARWLELGPNFIDDIRLYYRPKGSTQSWTLKQTGDLRLGQSDIDYRNPVFIVPPPEHQNGYEAIIRVQSSSTTILQATLWQPDKFLNHATATTSFWSFYFGLVTISSILAIILAVVLGGRLLWSVAAFSVTYVFVASIQGYINWLMPSLGVPLQHYLTSALTLTSYVLLLWLCVETVDMKRHLPWAYRITMTIGAITLLLMVLIPLDLYGLAVKIQALFYLPTSLIFIGSVFYVWHLDRYRPSTLLLGLSPLTCITGSLLGLFSAFGWIPFKTEIYVIWQYALLVNMLLVMSIAVYRVREKKLEELEKHQLASELKAERDASFHQRQFMGMVSHEFRTPLAVISGSLENLRYLESDNQDRTPRYNKIQRATDRLVQLTDNCLADARLAADNLYLDPQPANLFEVIESAAALVELTDTHKLILSTEGQPSDQFPDSQCTAIIDTALMRIAFSNVIDNAVKHSAGGTIQVDCSRRDGRIAVSICDQGPGIDEENAEQIFERYRRGTHSNRGAGLGLYVARQIARAHEGDLKLLSSSSEGSCFAFFL